MSLLTDYKNSILIIIITVVLGYFLGMTVSTVVDYRLKETIVKLPKQNHNIIVKLDKNNNIKNVEKFKSGKKSKKNPTKKSKSKKTKNSTKTVEPFANPTKNVCKDPAQLYKYNLKMSPKEVEDPFHQWQEFEKNIKIEDPNLKKYSKNFKKNSNKGNLNSSFVASNQEDADQMYQKFVEISNTNDKTGKKKSKKLKVKN